MKLTTFSNYCMRVLMLAAARAPELTTVREVAARFDIAETHIVKCVHLLGAWGYLETIRGHRGGFRLARAAGEIRVGEVMRRSEDSFAVVECMNPATDACRIAGRCPLARALARATAAFLAVLDEVTLADLCADAAEWLDALTPVDPGCALVSRS